MLKLQKFVINNFLFIVLGLLLLAMIMVPFNGRTAHASPSVFPFASTCQTPAATSSPVVLSGTASSSVITCDSYNYGQGFNPQAFDSGVLAIQASTGSTTIGTLTVTITYSNDGIDYYGSDLNINSANATTTGAITIGTDNTITWTFPATGTLYKKLITLPTPTRFTKVTFTSPTANGATSTAVSVWSQLILKQQVQ